MTTVDEHTASIVEIGSPDVEPIDVRRGQIGDSVDRPDVPAKIDGTFEFSNDVTVPGALHGATVRSPHPHAALVSIDASEALARADVVCVLTAADLPTDAELGHITADQPPFVRDVARYVGEPVAFVVAHSQESAWAAADAVRVEWQPLPVVDDPAQALADDAPLVHPAGNVIRELVLARGPASDGPASDDPASDHPASDHPASDEVTVEGAWHTGRQDQAFLGPESAMAYPDGDGGVTLVLATQDLHTDQRQIAAVLGVPHERVRLVMSGIGGAFGGREDITCQVHLALAALVTGRPVRTTYRRAESFLAHPKRHPATMRHRLTASRTGVFRRLEVDLVLDGGPYASTSGPVLGSACYFAAGPYRIPSVRVRGRAVRTNNPVSGAMRGFGAVQACFGIESTVDLLAGALGIDPVELRRRNVLAPGDEFPTSGQLVGPSAPVRELIDACVAIPMPVARSEPASARRGLGAPRRDDPYALPGGTGSTTRGEGVRRGVGFALGVKNHLYGEGTPEWATATVSVDANGVVVESAAAEVGQGIVSALAQIAADELGGLPVRVDLASTDAGYAGSSSASRQTWMSGAAVARAAVELRTQLLQHAMRVAERSALADASGSGAGIVDLAILGPDGVEVDGRHWSLGDVLGSDRLSVTSRYDAPPTRRGDPTSGQGDVHVSWMFVAHRAVVDVDVDLGLCRVVQVATAQDVGRAINPREVLGQIRGGIAQGIGLALNEHLSSDGGRVANNSFTDYLIPTAADVAPVEAVLIEVADTRAPYGLKGAGEPPSLSSTAAVAAAVRAATGRPVARVPIRPDDLVC